MPAHPAEAPQTIRHDEAVFRQALASVEEAVAQGKGLRFVFVRPDRAQRTEALTTLLEAVSLNVHQYGASNLVADRFVDTTANLREAFDQADEKAALLFFDEGDALFAPSRQEDAGEQHAGALTPADYFFQRADAFEGALVLCLADRRFIEKAAAQGFEYIVEF